MKKFFLALGLLLLILAGESQLVEARGAETHTGSEVIISENVDGPLFVSGYDVVIDGNVDGIVFAAGQSVTINGDVTGMVFVAGQNVTINGTVDGEVFAAGEKLAIGEDGVVSQEFFGASYQLIVDGEISRDIFYGGNLLTVNNLIGRDAYFAGSSINFGDEGQIGRDLRYEAETQNMNAQDHVAGEVNYSQYINPEQSNRQSDIWMGIISAIVTIISAWLLWLFLRRFTDGAWITIPERVKNHPFNTMLVGLGVALLTLLAIVVLFIVVVFSEIAGGVLFLFIGLNMLIGFIVASVISKYYVENWITANSALTFVLTFTVLYLLSQIPYVGWIVPLFSALYAYGLAYRYIQERI